MKYPVMGLLIAAAWSLAWTASGVALPDESATEAALSSAQQSAIRHRNLGDVYQQRERLSEAREEWQTALELDPDCPGVRERLAENSPATPTMDSLRVRTGAPTEAGNSQASGPVAEAAQALHYYRESRLREAELMWQRVLAMDPGNAIAQEGLAELAREAYQKQSDRSFDQMVEELYEEGMRAYRREDWAKAGVKLAQAANLNPQQPQVCEFLGLAREAAEQQERVATCANLKAKAEIAEKQKCWAEARSYWLQITRLDTKAGDAWQGVSRTTEALERWAGEELATGRAYADAGATDQAVKHYETVLKVFPEHQRALAEIQRVRNTQAEARIRSESKAQASTWFNTGTEAYRRGDLAAAITAWKKAVDLDPMDQESRQWLEKAQEAWEVQKEANRKKAEIRYADGLAAYQRGDLDETVAAWKEALVLDPGMEKARVNLKRIQAEMK